MKANMKASGSYLSSTYYGIVFIQGFTWFLLLILALLFEKGLDTIVKIGDIYVLEHSWTLLIYVLLFINFLLFAFRYLIWAPWPIFSKIFEFNKISDKEKKTTKGKRSSTKSIRVGLEFRKVLSKIINISSTDVRLSFLTLVVEFIIIYLAILNIDRVQIFILFLIALPIVDFGLFYFFGFVINRNRRKNMIFNVYHRGFKNYFPKEFFYANLRDLGGLFILIIVFFLVSLKYEYNYFEAPISTYKIILACLLLCLTLLNFISLKRLTIFYQNVAQVISNQSFIKEALYSNVRPKAYADGNCNFMGIELDIDERVYPPTPETSFLVTKAIEHLGGKKQPNIIDVGTGSGNIAIVLASKFPNAKVYGLDSEDEALDVAIDNRDKLELNNIEFHISDLINAETKENCDLRNADLVVANLPYGDQRYLLRSNPPESLVFMPSKALFSRNGLIGDYIELFRQIKSADWTTTMLFEVGPIPEDEIKKEFKMALNEEIETISDFEFIPKDKEYAIIKISIPKK